MLSTRLAVKVMVGLVLLSGVTHVAVLADNLEQTEPLFNTVVQGIENRRQLVSSARGILLMETTSSDAYMQHHKQELQKLCQQYEVPLVDVQPFDVTCASFAYDESRYVWHLSKVNDSGCDWWGIGNQLGLMTPGEPRPSPGALVRGGAADGGKAYEYNASMRSCAVFDQDAAGLPLPVKLFKTRFVEHIYKASLDLFLESSSPTVVGTTEYGGEKCFVIAGAGQHDGPRGMRRMWVTSDHFVVLRMEHVEVDAAGKLASASSVTASAVTEAAPGVWLPTEVMIDFMGNIDEEFTWEWTKRLTLHDFSINEDVQLTPADYLFSPGSRWRDVSTGEVLWDGGRGSANRSQYAMVSLCDQGLLEIAEHAADLEEWMLRPAE